MVGSSMQDGELWLSEIIPFLWKSSSWKQ